MARTPQPVHALAERPSAQVQAWTAQAHGLDQQRHPRLIKYIARHGRWPTFAGRWGTDRPLQPGGWAARLLEAIDGDLSTLRAITLTPDRATAAALGRMTPAQGLREVMADFPEGGPWTPEHGALRVEWCPSAGWHIHALVHIDDVEDLVRWPGAGPVEVTELADLDSLTKWVRYLTKQHRKHAPRWELAAFAEHWLTLMDELKSTRLPSTLLTFGAASRDLGHSSLVSPASDPSQTAKIRSAHIMRNHGLPRSVTARALGLSESTITRYLALPDPTTEQPQPTAEAGAIQENTNNEPPQENLPSHPRPAGSRSASSDERGGHDPERRCRPGRGVRPDGASLASSRPDEREGNSDQHGLHAQRPPDPAPRPPP